MIDELFGVLLVVRAAGDVTGAKSLPKIDALIWAIVNAVCGWGPDDAIGVFRLSARATAFDRRRRVPNTSSISPSSNR